MSQRVQLDTLQHKQKPQIEMEEIQSSPQRIQLDSLQLDSSDTSDLHAIERLVRPRKSPTKTVGLVELWSDMMRKALAVATACQVEVPVSTVRAIDMDQYSLPTMTHSQSGAASIKFCISR